ncbi:uncharacterized protein F4822DRAFT_337662 [Hypoxylon trugodes]|uniref:uncharacterized protein n=1 Tax=Hypoxylon trugodes TaxID=326681 RepID=UPI00219E9AD8|nr:uncharacterized protein F4822DRAFT_337662 [Hypoxylon trugodes]KAI1385224.1 hypothetical protein F4822DRAFT_337662 [Hypoxylon trugodes]
MRKMRILNVFIATLLATEVAAECEANECLRAVQNAASSLRKEDCQSFARVTITPATSTVVSSITVTTTGTTARTTTQTTTSSAQPPKRWLQRHEVINVLMGRAVSDDGPITARATSIPTYASPCASAAYESACSCFGITQTTVTASASTTTKTPRIVETTTIAAIHTTTKYALGHNSSSLFGNSTSGRFGNSTALHRNTTSSGIYSSSIFTSSFSLGSSDAKTSTDKYRLKSPSIAEATSSSEPDITQSNTISSTAVQTSISSGFGNTTGSSSPNATVGLGKFSNSTSATRRPSAASVTGFQSGTAGTAGALTNATIAAPFLNSTRAATANVTSSVTKLLSNATTSAPFMNITSVPSLRNHTLAPFLNSTHHNITVLSANATRTAPFANSTSSVRFANTTSTVPMATPTSTTLCEKVSDSFALRVAQPGGMFDGWYVQLSGDGAIFNPSVDRASRFSLDEGDADRQHLCSLGGAGLVGNSSAVVAIAENRTESAGGDNGDGSGSAVYFVDPDLLDEIENKQHGWYAPLECNGAGSAPNSTAKVARAAAGTLACAQGAMEYWVGCGLGLDITSEGGGVAVVDGWNCTSITLSIEYTQSS